MSAAEAREQVGKYEFSVAVCEEKPDSEQCVEALANWLLEEWERETGKRGENSDAAA